MPRKPPTPKRFRSRKDEVKFVESFVVRNINHPASQTYLRSLGTQGSNGRIRVNTLMKQGITNKQWRGK